MKISCKYFPSGILRCVRLLAHTWNCILIVGQYLVVLNTYISDRTNERDHRNILSFTESVRHGLQNPE